jgi:hypothetical protein
MAATLSGRSTSPGWHNEPESDPQPGEDAVLNRVASQLAGHAAHGPPGLAVAACNDLPAGLRHEPPFVEAAGCGDHDAARTRGDDLHTGVLARIRATR